MAKDAIIVYPNGDRKPILAIDLTEEEREYDFLCRGVTEDGEPCGCPVRPSSSNARNPYFYESDKRNGHKPGCSNSRKRTTIDIETLDRTGENTTIKHLFDKNNCDKPQRSKKNKTVKADNFYGIEYENIEEDSDENEKEIRSKKRNPRNFREILALFASLNTNDKYAGQYVFDYILDERTVAAYRRMASIPQNTPFIITAKKAVPAHHNIRLNNSQWLLMDYWGGRDNAFLFILNVTPTAKEKLLKFCEITPPAKIQVWGEFHRHPTRAKVYISELVRPEMIHAEVSLCFEETEYLEF